MKKSFWKKGIRMAAALTALILMTGCGKEIPQTSAIFVPMPTDEAPETEKSPASTAQVPETEAVTAQEPETEAVTTKEPETGESTAAPTGPADTGTAGLPTETGTGFYHADPEVAPEAQAELSGASLKIVSTRFTYYEDPYDGFPAYHLIIELRNTGSAAVFTPWITVKLYDGGHELLAEVSPEETVYGIMAPGATEYVYAEGYLKVRDGGSYAPMEVDLSEGIVPVIESVSTVNECDMSQYTFIECETDIRMETTASGRPAFSGTVTNPADRELVPFLMHHLLFNADGEIIGIVAQGVMNFQAKQTREVMSTTLPNWEITPDQVASFVTVADAWWNTTAR